MNFDDYFTLGTSLIGVIGVILLAYFAAKWLNGRLSVNGSTKGIQILDKLFLSQNKALMIVQVGEKFLLLALADKQVTKLTDLSKNDVAELLEKRRAQQENGKKNLLPTALFSKGKKDEIPFDEYLNQAYKREKEEEKLK